MLNVGLIEDNKEYREELKSYFEKESDIIACPFAVDSVDKFLKYYSLEMGLDILLLDIQLMGLDGIRGLPKIRKKYGDQFEIIMLTSFDDPQLIFQSLTAGASGYLLKSMTFKEIESELIKVTKNGAAMAPQVARRIIRYFNPSPKKFFGTQQPKLSDKELQICQLVVDGKTYEEIAPMLGLTINGLKYHVKNIYKKLRVSSKAGLVSKFLK